MTNKKKLLIAIIPVFIIGIILYTKPVSRIINVESRTYGTPANSAFKDDTFYKYVVMGYNSTVPQYEEVSYDTNLTDEQLARIKEIAFYGSLHEDEKITDTSGIEKLTSLKSLAITDTDLLSIDLSNNISLTKVRLYGNNLTNIDVSNNTLIEELDLTNNNLTNIDVSKNNNLKILFISDNNLSNIDVSNNNNLSGFSIRGNNLTSIDISKNVFLKTLYLNGNKLSSIDVTNNTNLTSLTIQYNLLTNIDLTNNDKLSTLYLFGNNFESDNVVIYKNVDYSFLNLGSTVKLPNTITYNFDGYHIMKGDSFGPEINDNSINFNKSGQYVVSASYFHSLPLPNGFSIKYTFNVVEAMSDKYIIDENNNYIYTGTDIADRTILQNINLTEYDGITGTIENNKYIIKYNDEVLKEFDLINIFSNKYDLSKNYLIGEIANITNNIIVTNGKAEFNLLKNKVEIKHNDDVLQEFDYVNYTSDKYDLNSDYIKVNDNNIETFLNNINCTNCKAYVYDGINNLTTGEFKNNYKLRIMHNDEVLKEYELKYSVSGVSLNTNDLKLNLEKNKTYNLIANITPTNAENKNVTWESSNPEVATVDENGLVTAKSLGEATITVKTIDGEFIDTCNVVVSEIIIYTVTFKDKDNTYTSEFEEGENIIFKSDLEKKGYKLIGWKYNNQNYSLTDKLPMPSNNIELDAIWELVKPEIKNYTTNQENITGISLKTNVDSLNLGIDSMYDVKIKKHDGTDKTSGLVSTGDKVKIYLDNEPVSEYDVIIKGDVTGTGTSTVSDVAKLYQYMKGKVTMDECYIKAGNVVDSDSTIKVNDVAKLYQFIKGKINNL